ncbi:T-cell immunoglobulin and mucin domain-containing protein 4-like [Cynoglossus semilaevis]|uniref:T-cell immunoglobulin and mucin domain-containing protein 4-like n=1 Tax=Cynoglossus semilaevis TaxID=244447 RepID=UPI0007DC8C23|nr:T-cell immunoglobulin and mucin domain-containing protein 4-like [Cynoglossus semilaevis]
MRNLYFVLVSVLTGVASEILTEVGGLTGHNVTLPCVYDVDSHGVLDFCWGRGKVPRFKCSDTFLSSEDQSVLNEDPSRYQVLGSPTDGDVSLTIVDAQWSDEGVYGCRIQIPGWFNDIKVNIRLVLKQAPVEEITTQKWISVTAGDYQRHLEKSTSALTSTGADQRTLSAVEFVVTQNKFNAFLDVGNVVRMGAIFFSTIIIILVFISQRRFQPGVRLQPVNTSAAENIYESIPAASQRW